MESFPKDPTITAYNQCFKEATFILTGESEPDVPICEIGLFFPSSRPGLKLPVHSMEWTTLDDQCNLCFEKFRLPPDTRNYFEARVTEMVHAPVVSVCGHGCCLGCAIEWLRSLNSLPPENGQPALYYSCPFCRVLTTEDFLLVPFTGPGYSTNPLMFSTPREMFLEKDNLKLLHEKEILEATVKRLTEENNAFRKCINSCTVTLARSACCPRGRWSPYTQTVVYAPSASSNRDRAPSGERQENKKEEEEEEEDESVVTDEDEDVPDDE